MEREIVSLTFFREMLSEMGFSPDESKFYVNTLLNAASDNVPAYYSYDGVSMTVTPCNVTVDCDIECGDININIAFFNPVGE